jgi:hypothetical protein
MYIETLVQVAAEKQGTVLYTGSGPHTDDEENKEEKAKCRIHGMLTSVSGSVPSFLRWGRGEGASTGLSLRNEEIIISKWQHSAKTTFCLSFYDPLFGALGAKLYVDILLYLIWAYLYTLC